MDTAQRDAAFALLQTSQSAYGLQKSLDIISLQNDLGNDPELYYVTVFGTPGVEPWGWRWEGHHLSRRFNIINGKLSVTPFFLGAWPTVNNNGLKAMEREEWAARELVTSLDESQRAGAVFQQETLGRHVTQNDAYVTPLQTVGIAASNLDENRQALVTEIIHKYLDTLPDMIAASHLDRLQAAGFENIFFAWAFADMGEGQRAHELFDLINPIHHGDTLEKINRYRVEPYVIAADVYSTPPHNGRGGWTWYTGSASWMYRLGVERLLGITRIADHLEIHPCIPGHWKTYQINYRFGMSVYHIRVENPQGESDEVGQITINGEKSSDMKIPLQDDGKQYEVLVTMK